MGGSVRPWAGRDRCSTARVWRERPVAQWWTYITSWGISGGPLSGGEIARPTGAGRPFVEVRPANLAAW